MTRGLCMRRARRRMGTRAGYSDADSATLTLAPLNMYGMSKHLFDLWALRNGLFGKIAGLKYFNVYGPGEGTRATCAR